MVLHSSQVNYYKHPLPLVIQAHNIRFPSPYSDHVLSSDVIERTFKERDGHTIIYTKRLVLKRGKMPAWAPKSLRSVGTSWVVEESEIDATVTGDLELRAKSANIDHTNVLTVAETQVYSSELPDLTQCSTSSELTSEISLWPVRAQIERFSMSRVPKSTEKSRNGMNYILSILENPLKGDKLLKSGPLKPYPFDKIPTKLDNVKHKFEELPAKLDNVKQRLEQFPSKFELKLAAKYKNDNRRWSLLQLVNTWNWGFEICDPVPLEDLVYPAYIAQARLLDQREYEKFEQERRSEEKLRLEREEKERLEKVHAEKKSRLSFCLSSFVFWRH